MRGNFKSIVAAAVAMMCVGLSSCSDDNKGPNGGGVKPNPTTVFTQGLPTQVGNYVITKDANGLVTKIADDEEVITFNYAPTKTRGGVNIPTDYDMTMNVEWGNDEDGVDFYIKLNKQGYIAYAYEVDEDKYDGARAEEWWFKYDSQGRMIEMKRTEGDNEVTTITYNDDGDIIKVSVSDDEGNNMVTTVAYIDATHSTPILNKSGIMLYDASLCIDMDEMAPAYFAGLLGRGTTHLPLAAIEDGEYFYTFTWEFNASEMPIKFTRRETSWDGSEYTDDPIIFKW